MVSREQVVKEVHEFIQFHHDWAAGTIPKDFSSWWNVVDENIEFITPSGNRLFYKEVGNAIYNLYGIFGEHGVSVSVENVRASEHAGVWVTQWEEVHTEDATGYSTRRITSVVMVPDSSQKNGLRYVHAHETWLDTNKLVRNGYPEFLEMQQGKAAIVETVADEEYRAALEAKLRDDVRKFLDQPEDRRRADLVEILEVVRTMGEFYSISFDELVKAADEAKERHGGFDGGKIWKGME